MEEQNEIRYYLKVLLAGMAEVTEDELKIAEERGEVVPKAVTPTHLITATELPTGAREITINTENIQSKIECILRAYDEDMKLLTNADIKILNIMVV